MKELELRKRFYWTGVIDADLRVFDIIMYTEFGTTYNSYVMKAGDKVVLFETAKVQFFEEYIEKLKELIDVTKIDYLVMDHTEPDHAGSLVKLLDYCPQLKVIATGCAIQFLKKIVNRDFYSITVKDNQEMTIGDKTLQFFILPNLHWPDTMYTYIKEEKILVTCDSFGSHYAFDQVLLSKVTHWDDYMKATKYYFDNIIGSYKSYMLHALDRIKGLEISMICTGHGPVLDARIDEMIQMNRDWCTVVNPNSKKTVVIPYVSAYGYTGQIAGKISEGIQSSGDIEVKIYDMVTSDQTEVLAEIGFADGLLFGTPTIVGEALKPIWELLTSIFAQTHGGKLASAFGSYGWSGEGVPHIVERLRQLRMEVVDGFQVKFKPNEVELKDAYEYGYHFGYLLQHGVSGGKNAKASAKTHLVKCIVCGEIFDSSLEVCPVCGVGKEYFIPVEEEVVEFKKDTKDSYLILGNGAAGLNAAKAIRDRDKTGRICLISNEPYLAYNRPMLTKSLMADLNPEQIVIHEESWYVQNKIEQMLSTEVVGINTEEQMVILSDQSGLPYDKLIYALGAECFVPPIIGADKPEVIAIRRLEDTIKIVQLLPHVDDVVVIGGGVLGLEAAWELKKVHCNVTVLEMAPRLMARQLDEPAAQMLQSISESVDITVRTNVKIAAIDGDTKVTGVRLEDGEVITAQLVILSCGIRAKVDLGKAAGLTVDRAIVVDKHMATNLPSIFACGDCAEYQGMNYGIWPEAVEQGKVAGACAVGDNISYQLVSPALTFHAMNTELYANGDNGLDPNKEYKTLELKDCAKNLYKKYYFEKNYLCGVILIGDMKDMNELTECIERKATYQEVIKKIGN